VSCEEGEVITLYQLRYWYGRKQDKRENRKHKKHIAIPVLTVNLLNAIVFRLDRKPGESYLALENMIQKSSSYKGPRL
jgi:hypothetical protein